MLTDVQVKTILLRQKLLTRKDFISAESVAKHLGSPVIDVLVGRNIVSEEQYGRALAKFYRVKYADLSKIKIPQSVLAVIPEQFAISMRVVAFARKDRELWVAMTNPKDLETLNLVKKTVGLSYKIIPFVTVDRQITESLRLYKSAARTEQMDRKEPETRQEPTTAVALADRMLEDAIRADASDIHIEPLEDRLLIRFRIDGVLHDQGTYPSALHPTIIARIKILSDLKIDELRLPQDGQFSFTPQNGRKVSLRVSTTPTVYGEKVVMRILHDTLSTFELKELGLLTDDMTAVERVLKRTHGMFLVTGPTGSGKTTTLYTILGLLNQPGVNIMTIEDPVENRVRRVNQIQVNTTINLTFAGGLRSMLRQDPDIIMVGEIRDRETAVIAVNAAMTGHLVFSSVHANTAAGAIPRMIDLGVEPFLLASTVNMVIAQRLVRLLCPRCTEAIPVSPVAMKMLDDAKETISPAIRTRVTSNFAARGCAYCHRTGYRGRIGIFELFDVDESAREQIVSGATTDQLWKQARKKGVKTMLEDGLLKVAARQTTIEEVFRVISA